MHFSIFFPRTRLASVDPRRESNFFTRFISLMTQHSTPLAHAIYTRNSTLKCSQNCKRHRFFITTTISILARITKRTKTVTHFKCVCRKLREMVKPNNVEKPAREQQRDSSYRGVRKRKWGKFVTEIRLPNSRQRIWLGSYDTAQKAARAFDAAMFCLRGTHGWFNFPDDLPDIAGERCMTPSQIRAAAVCFANSEPQMDNLGRVVIAPVESEKTGLLPMESLSPPLSEVTVATDSDARSSGSFHDLFSKAESGNYDPDYYAFLGFDDFSGDFYMSELPSFDYTEENTEGLIFQDSFLWSF